MTYSARAVNAKANAIADLLDGGVLELCGGNQPTSADTVVTDYAPLARLTFGVPAFHHAVDGVLDAYPLEPEAMAGAAGTARWFRCCTADGYPVLDGTVGTHDADCTLSNTTILVGSRVTIDGFRLTEPREDT